MQRLVFKKGDTICNLCEQKHNLTYDHIPPQCCGNHNLTTARRIYAEELVAQQVDSTSHNGLKWKTLCRPCNGDLIGRWDPALGEFTKRVEWIIDPRLALPQRLAIAGRPGPMLRSILGHVVAAKTQGDGVPMDEKIRDYLLGRGPLDASIEVYCWLYPHRPIVVSRDFTWVELNNEGGKSPGVATVIKFYPLAFLVLDARGQKNFETKFMTALHPYAALDEKVEAPLDVWRAPVIPAGWPERPMGDHLPLGGRTYVDSVTTVAAGGASVTPGKQVQAESWPGGDPAGIFNGLHAFVEVPKN